MRIRLFTIVACLLWLPLAGKAQNLKIGYVKVETIFGEWPETRAANLQLQEYEGKLKSRLQAKVKDFQTKVASFNQNLATMDALTRKDSETELQNLQTQIQQFEANAQQSVSEKNAILLKPLQSKLQASIEQVAKENGYTHILHYGTALVYTSDIGNDISAKVAQKLGFTLSSDTR